MGKTIKHRPGYVRVKVPVRRNGRMTKEFRWRRDFTPPAPVVERVSWWQRFMQNRRGVEASADAAAQLQIERLEMRHAIRILEGRDPETGVKDGIDEFGCVAGTSPYDGDGRLKFGEHDPHHIRTGTRWDEADFDQAGQNRITKSHRGPGGWDKKGWGPSNAAGEKLNAVTGTYFTLGPKPEPRTEDGLTELEWYYERGPGSNRPRTT